MNSIQTFFFKASKMVVHWKFCGNTSVRSGLSIFIYADRFRSAAWICRSYRY